MVGALMPDASITVSFGQALTISSVLIAAGGIIWQVRSLASRVGRIEMKVDKMNNGMTDKFVTRRECDLRISNRPGE